MNGIATLYTSLSNDTDLMDAIDYGPEYGSTENVTWPADSKTVTYYQAGVIDHTLDYLDNTLTVNCRAQTESSALEIAALVVAAVNRVSITGGGRYYCSQLPPIAPADDADSHNVPVEVQIKGSKSLD